MTTFYQSLWSAGAINAPDCPPLLGPADTNVVVIGAGYTGLSAAVHLARSGMDTIVLEADEPGFGCSGRNGGQVNPGSTRMVPSEVIKTLGPQWGERFLQFGDQSCDLVFELIKRYNIECEAVRPGYIQGGYGTRGDDINKAWVGEWAARGADVKKLSADQMLELTGSPGYQSGFIDARGGNIQPLSYARGLAHAAISEGAKIFGGSAATSIVREGAQWRVTTAQGSVMAKHVVLATNGYTDGLWPGLAETIVPTTSVLCATEPLPESTLANVLPGRHAVSETARVIVYYRRDEAGRFIIGAHGNLFNSKETADATHVRDAAVRLFPALSGAQWQYQWGGWPAITKDRTPHLFELDEGVFAGLGYNGRGVASATLMGSQLASLILGDAQPPLIQMSSLSGFAMHRFRQIGISYHLISGRWLDRRDRAN